MAEPGTFDRLGYDYPRTEWAGVGLVDLDHERQQLVHQVLGGADWIYDPEIGHIPCCTHIVGRHASGFPIKCGNGPLEGTLLRLGDCGEHDDG